MSSAEPWEVLCWEHGQTTKTCNMNTFLISRTYKENISCHTSQPSYFFVGLFHEIDLTGGGTYVNRPEIWTSLSGFVIVAV
ncbi:hypothetical protein GDO78_004650 [Eleutherodactylus coqui]|uniref:Uncharacterized protein n=1 Tax=Eleutherodactylus coqui TaxID=57060 RepID=A0A8J6K014_ELECQ|nr:hypothetical protein GDO78_004650 [Eleutherodactylus coqui]